MSSLTAFLHALNTLTPVGLLALTGLIVFMLVWDKGPVKLLLNNHLSHLQDSADEIVKTNKALLDTAQRQEQKLSEIHSSIEWVKGRLN